MRNLIFDSLRFRSVSFIGILLICAIIFLGFRYSTNNVSSQEMGHTQMDAESQMPENEKSLVELLLDKSLLKTCPEQIMEAIKELGKIARSRGISSKKTIETVAQYLGVPRDSMSTKTRDPIKESGILFETHPILADHIYPAVETIAYIGDAAIPTLLKMIERSEINSISSENALFILKYNYKGNVSKAGECLTNAAKMSTSEEGRTRLLIAADKMNPN